jgi:hypothetical protein
MSDLHALLIGINCYLPNKLSNGLYYKSLWGCVQDIQQVESFLRKRLSVPAEHIIKLTSSTGSNGQPLEPLAEWPTYENIVNAFTKLRDTARPSDQVYVHYSGHGGRAPTTPAFHALKGADGIDEVLVPMDLGDSEGRYLRDTELQHLIKELIDKKLTVTIVLDSCHAGGATRGSRPVVDPDSNGVGVRGIGEVDTTLRRLDSLVASSEQLLETWVDAEKTTRAAEAASGWLLEPEGYVLMAACRANEYANEVVFQGTEKNGALTYWLVDSLTQVGPGFTYKMLHDRVLAKVHGQFVDQTPQLQGDGDRVVFGIDRVPRQHAVTLVKVTADDTVVLNAGLAHDVHEGSHFSVYALNEPDLTKINNRIAVVEIVSAGPTNSSARIVSKLDGSTVEPGCQAVLLDAGPTRLRRRARLGTDRRVRQSADAGALQRVEQELAMRTDGLVVLDDGEASSDYLVAVEDDVFVICDPAGNAIPNLRPALNVADENAPARLVERLIHLAKYANVRTLDNKSSTSTLAYKIIVELVGEPSHSIAGDQPELQANSGSQTLTLLSGESCFLRIKNNYSGVINVTVLDLQPDWGISQIYPARSGAFETLDPGKEIMLPLRVTLPPGYESGTDVIKVFCTLEPTSFRWLELPALDQPPADLRGVPANPLEELFLAVSSENSATRTVGVVPELVEAEWVAHQVEIDIRTEPSQQLIALSGS